MKFRGTLVKPLDEQHDTDGHRIDPAGVKFEDKEYPVWANFSYDTERDLLGTGHVVVQEDGSLGFEGELNDDRFEHPKLAIGVRVDDFTDSLVETSELFAVSLTETHQDPDQPEIEVER